MYSSNELGELPSELLEPFLKRFLVMQIEAVGAGLETPEKAKSYLKGVEYFVSSFGGIHARFACSNEYSRFCDTPDELLIQICKQVIN